MLHKSALYGGIENVKRCAHLQVIFPDGPECLPRSTNAGDAGSPPLLYIRVRQRKGEHVCGSV